MIDRRLALKGSIAAGILLPSKPARAQTGASFNPVAEWGFRPNVLLSETDGPAPTGNKPPRNKEIVTAFRILYNAPRDGAPLDIARYFEENNEKNDDGNYYHYEWPKDGRANPVIVGFFSSTFTIPSSGDQTSWCAAFVNFCLMVSGRITTSSALSGSFRDFPSYPRVNQPREGDIVVFRAGGARGDAGFGHVGFFLSEDGDRIKVLGGNQVGSTDSTGAVTVTSLPYKSDDLSFHSFRSIR